jgi:hypothetical protein
MDEPEVKRLARAWLETAGFKVTPEPAVPDTNRDVLLDFYGWKAGNPPEIVWVEAKGDVGISDLLEGFIRTEFACHQGGGHGILAVPREQAERLAKYSDFLSQAPHVKVQPFPIDDKTTP